MAVFKFKPNGTGRDTSIVSKKVVRKIIARKDAHILQLRQDLQETEEVYLVQIKALEAKHRLYIGLSVISTIFGVIGCVSG